MAMASARSRVRAALALGLTLLASSSSSAALAMRVPVSASTEAIKSFHAQLQANTNFLESADASNFAAQRAIEMKKLMMADAKTALAHADELHAVLSHSSASTSHLQLESAISGTADVELLCPWGAPQQEVPKHDGGCTCWNSITLHHADGKKTYRSLLPEDHPLAGFPKYGVRVSGYAMDDVAVLHPAPTHHLESVSHSDAEHTDHFQSKACTTNAKIQSRTGVKNLLFINVDFPDKPGFPRTKDQLLALGQEIDAYYRAASFGKTNVVTTTAAMTNTLRMPRNTATYIAGTGYSLLRQDAEAAANAAGIEVCAYEMEVINFAQIGYDWAGLGAVGAKPAWINGYFNLQVTGHELGHNYGLPHAAFWRTGTTEPLAATGTSLEYGDTYDVMGGQGTAKGHVNIIFKAKLTWINEQVNVKNFPVTDTLTAGWTGLVGPMDVQGYGGAPLAGVSVQRTNAIPAGYAYWLSTRALFPEAVGQLNFHTEIREYAIPGSYLLDLHGETNSLADAGLFPGESYSDCGQQIHITNGGTQPCPTTATLTCVNAVVKKGANPSVTPFTLTAGPQIAAAGARVQFTATTDATYVSWRVGNVAAGGAVVNGVNTFAYTLPAQNNVYLKVTVTLSDAAGRRARYAYPLAVGTPAGAAPNYAADMFRFTCQTGRLAGYAPAPATPGGGGVTPTQPRAYAWATSAFAACSTRVGAAATDSTKWCGGGTATRQVACRDATGATVADANCATAGAKPAAMMPCDTGACATYQWAATAFAACDKTCGGGTQQRTVTCRVATSSDPNLRVGTTTTDVTNCKDPKPAESQACNTQPCAAYAWAADPTFGACSKTCGGGVQTRNVVCKSSATGASVAPVNVPFRLANRQTGRFLIVNGNSQAAGQQLAALSTTASVSATWTLATTPVGGQVYLQTTHVVNAPQLVANAAASAPAGGNAGGNAGGTTATLNADYVRINGATATKCLQIIAARVYDMTAYAANHPGGSGLITGQCGADATRAYQGQGAHLATNLPTTTTAQYQGIKLLGAVGATISTGGAGSGAATGGGATAGGATATLNAAYVNANGATAAKCLQIIGTRVYDMTAYAANHPGGSPRIIAQCGKDATNAYQTQTVHLATNLPTTTTAQYQGIKLLGAVGSTIGGAATAAPPAGGAAAAGDGFLVTTAAKAATPAQYFTFNDKGDGYFQIVVGNTNKALDVAANGAVIVSTPSATSATQLWRLTRNDGQPISSTATVPDAQCAGAGAKPAATQACNTQPCVAAAYAWTMSAFTQCQCEADSTDGTHTRTVACTDSTTNAKVQDSQCTGDKPTEAEDCTCANNAACSLDCNAPYGQCAVVAGAPICKCASGVGGTDCKSTPVVSAVTVVDGSVDDADEGVKAGDTVKVTWTVTGGDKAALKNVNIMLWHPNGIAPGYVARNVPNTGSYDWLVNVDHLEGPHYVEVSLLGVDQSVATVKAQSATFPIVDPCKVLGVNCQHGKCSLGLCACEAGWTGATCALPQQCAAVGKTCNGHGTCSLEGVANTPTCNCTDGYTNGAAGNCEVLGGCQLACNRGAPDAACSQCTCPAGSFYTAASKCATCDLNAAKCNGNGVPNAACTACTCSNAAFKGTTCNWQVSKYQIRVYLWGSGDLTDEQKGAFAKLVMADLTSTLNKPGQSPVKVQTADPNNPAAALSKDPAAASTYILKFEVWQQIAADIAPPNSPTPTSPPGQAISRQTFDPLVTMRAAFNDAKGEFYSGASASMLDTTSLAADTDGPDAPPADDNNAATKSKSSSSTGVIVGVAIGVVILVAVIVGVVVWQKKKAGNAANASNIAMATRV